MHASWNRDDPRHGIAPLRVKQSQLPGGHIQNRTAPGEADRLLYRIRGRRDVPVWSRRDDRNTATISTPVLPTARSPGRPTVRPSRDRACLGLFATRQPLHKLPVNASGRNEGVYALTQQRAAAPGVYERATQPVDRALCVRLRSLRLFDQLLRCPVERELALIKEILQAKENVEIAPRVRAPAGRALGGLEQGHIPLPVAKDVRLDIKNLAHLRNRQALHGS